MARALRHAAAKLLDRARNLVRRLVVHGHGDAVLDRGRPVRLDDAERVEAAADPLGVVKPAQHPRHLLDAVDAAGLAFDEAGHEVATLVAEHLGRDPDPGRRDARLVLVVAVDPEQLGVAAADPEDVALAVHLDLEVAVRDPAAQRLDAGVSPRPEHADRLHDRTRSEAGSKSGSATTSAATRSPKLSTSTSLPGTASAVGR